MTEDLVNIEVDGRPLKARRGQMLIQATDAEGIYVPRFCYHEKLSVAANCRMCLVEVEKAPKPLPACATPVTEGMKAFTRSPKAIAAQKATMEFLLINHPLDCPICDQGGECELQDLAQGFGSSVSRFDERKRVVKDKNLGPLISTDMTRCIHCTRCVRFTAEIAGKQELGTTGRGESMEIGTWIERAVEHELSGNVIDLCPVGALNSKPFRHRGRSWEMTQHELVSPHDGVGSNLFGHVLRGELMRVVPRTNEAINETWIADRDRFSYEGVYAADRLRSPMLKRDGEWREASWEEALTTAAQGLKDLIAREGGTAVGVLGSPGATLEELHLLAQLARGAGCPNVDTRLRQTDFRGQDADPAVPGLGMAIADIDGLAALLVVGSQLRDEAPILAHRVRKAAVRGRARVSFVNPGRHEWLFPVAHEIACGDDGLLGELAALLRAASEAAGRTLPATVARIAAAAAPAETHRDIVAALAGEGARAILLGAVAMRHPAWADLRDAAAALAALTGAKLSLLPEGANAAGAALAGALPHRGPAGAKVEPGLDVGAMLERPLPGYLLFGAIEPEADILAPDAMESLRGARLVVAATPYVSESLKSLAHVLLPIGTFAETSGTYVNVEGRWQSFAGCIRPLGEARPGWKVLRVLGNLLGLEGFDYDSTEQVREELRRRTPGDAPPPAAREVGQGPRGAVPPVYLYALDAIVRRAPALQAAGAPARRSAGA